MYKSRLQRLVVLVVVLIWATTPVVGKITLREMNSLELMLYSFPFSVLVLFLALLSWDGTKGLRGLTLRDYGVLAFMGFLGCYLYNLLFFSALKIGSAQEVFILNYLWPIVLVLFANFVLGERLTKQKVLGVLLGFAGVATITIGGMTGSNVFSFNLAADALAILAACCYGLFSALGKKLEYDNLVATFYYYVFACIISLLTIPFFVQPRTLTLTELFGVAWFGAVTNGIAMFLWFKGLRMGEVARAASLVFLTPFVSLVYIFLFLHEPIKTASLIGLVLIIGGALLVNKKSAKVVQKT